MPRGRSAARARTLEFVVTIAHPHTHRFSVELRARGFRRGPAVFCLPAWSPGSYKIRDYARNVIRLEAHDGRGARLPVAKRDKSTWVVDRGGAGTVVLTYELYANEKSVRTCHVDDRHAFLVGPAVFLYVEGEKDRPARVRIRAPRGWKTSTGMTPDRGANAFRATDYDELVDAPLEIGTHKIYRWRQLGRAHVFAIHGRGDLPVRRLLHDTRRIIATEAQMFGGLPYRSYAFLLDLYAQGGGGLEHRNSCALISSRQGFAARSRYLQFLGLVSHEFFHTWNVKRIRPESLGPFDYLREVHTRLLWVMEGFTSYYDALILRRAGISTRTEYLGRLSDLIQRHRDTPGRQVQSLEDSSFDTWIKFYQTDENTPNATISYYEKGALVALLLDHEIRNRTADRKSLDDVLRLLWDRYGRRDRGFPEAEFPRIVEKVAEGPMDEFFARYVRGTGELPFEAALARVGLEPSDDGKKGPEPTLGIRLSNRAGPAVVSTVLADGPAYRDGLNARDEIVAWNGSRVDAASLTERIAQAKPGRSVTLSFFRDDELRRLRVKLGERPSGSYKLRLRAGITPPEKAALDAWLGPE